MDYRRKHNIGAVEIIIGINVILFALGFLFAKIGDYGALYIGDQIDFIRKYGASPDFTINNGAIWQIVTSIFLHGSLMHLFFNMYALFIFGKPLEIKWGKNKFLSFYLITGILANVASVLFFIFTNKPVALIGASGAIFGVLLAFGGYYPNTQLLLFFFIPIRVKWAIMLFAAIELFSEITGTASGIAHITHLFGFLFGFLYLLMFFKTNPIKEMFFPHRNNYHYYE
ncbi:MAG: rhomboid family intramembrane serine protease [Spirochaetes bacterium]|nr:rhomboid family intramembrane serine protease [Spirochaetota bacterium]